MTNQDEERDAPVRVLVVDDQQLVRDGIASLLRMQEGIAVVGTATNGQEALEQAITLRPDVILMDVRMPVMTGVEATARILRRARGYLLKDLTAQDLAHAVLAVSQGVYQLDAAVIERMIGASSRPNPADTSETQERLVPPQPKTKANVAPDSLDAASLTNREIEVLRLIATGATNREVADYLVISEGTVKNHLSNIFSRLGLRDRTQAVMYAREHGLL